MTPPYEAAGGPFDEAPRSSAAGDRLNDTAKWFELFAAPGWLHFTSFDPAKDHPANIGPSDSFDMSQPESKQQSLAWIAATEAAGFNVYQDVNLPKRRLVKKSDKLDMLAQRFAHVDLDPERSGNLSHAEKRNAILGRLPSLIAKLAPSLVVDSGNGLWLLWRLAEPLAYEPKFQTDKDGKPILDEKRRPVILQSRGEKLNQALAKMILGDAGVWDVSRIMPIPGTLNRPSPKKIERGYSPIPTIRKLYHNDMSRAHRLEDLEQMAADFFGAQQQKPQSSNDAKPQCGGLGLRREKHRDKLDTYRNSDGVNCPCGHASGSEHGLGTLVLWFLHLDLADDAESIIRDDATNAEWGKIYQPRGKHDLDRDLVKARQSATDTRARSESDGRSRRRGATPDDQASDPGNEGAGEAVGEPLSDDNRPVIKIRAGELDLQVTAAENALLKSGEPIYQKSGRLVRPIVDTVEASHGQTTQIGKLAGVVAPYLRDKLCKVAAWQQWMGGKKDKKWCAVNPPPDIAPMLLARDGEWKFPKVLGIITTPTLRWDGSLLNEPGYDKDSRLILLDPPDMPDIPEAPTKDEAEAGLSLIEGLFFEFPFKDEASKSVALSAVLTTVCRGAFPLAPMHACRASTAGTGKSYLFDVVSYITLGQPCPVMALGRDEAETEKRLGAALMGGQPIISIDNVNGDLGGDFLCQVIERQIVSPRILGKSEMPQIEPRCTMFATGNNIRVVGDMTRRVIQITLDAKMERPETRSFAGNPVAEVLADRGPFIAAALTVCRAYIVAGRPGKRPPIGSFEGWSDTVRSALTWLGRADPVDTMEAARAEDPKLQQFLAFMLSLKDALGGTGTQYAKTVAEIIRLADERLSSLDFNPRDDNHRYPDLRAALIEIAPNIKGGIDPTKLGKWLARNQDKIVDGLRLEKEPGHGGAMKWSIKNVL